MPEYADAYSALAEPSERRLPAMPARSLKRKCRWPHGSSRSVTTMSFSVAARSLQLLVNRIDVMHVDAQDDARARQPDAEARTDLRHWTA
jgi:hypothetical protein